MNPNPLSKGIVAINSIGVGTITRKMVRERAVELAVINGRAEQDVLKSDWEQAKRELTGGSETDPEELALEAMPESERWDPVPGSTGHQVPNAPSEDQDDEGRSESEQLVERGVDEAGHDQMLQAVKKQRADD